MRSPFPGMDPYVEQLDQWSDFRLRFSCTMNAHLNSKLPEHLYAQLVSRENRSLMPEGERLGELERFTIATINEVKTHRLLTVIDVLTPWHKRQGMERENYLAMRGRVMEGGLNFLEIDLLRGGLRTPLPNDRDLPAHDYRFSLIRGSRSHLEVWPWNLRHRLPAIRVSIGKGEVDLTLDVQDCFNELYEGSGYWKYIYLNPPEPPLKGADAEWAKSLVASLGRGFC